MRLGRAIASCIVTGKAMLAFITSAIVYQNMLHQTKVTFSWLKKWLDRDGTYNSISAICFLHVSLMADE